MVGAGESEGVEASAGVITEGITEGIAEGMAEGIAAGIALSAKIAAGIAAEMGFVAIGFTGSLAGRGERAMEIMPIGARPSPPDERGVPPSVGA